MEHDYFISSMIVQTTSETTAHESSGNCTLQGDVHGSDSFCPGVVHGGMEDLTDDPTFRCQVQDSDMEHHTRRHPQHCQDMISADQTRHMYGISEVQRQLASSLLALANEEPQQNQQHVTERNESSGDVESSPIYLCSVCSDGFESMLECEAHVKTHQNSTKKPQERPRQSSSKLVEPKQTPTFRKAANDEIKCLVKGCQYQFTKSNLQKHVECHNPMEGSKGNKNQFSCPQCPSNFKNWRTCALHLWRQHKVDVDLLTCPVCSDFKTLFPASLQIHMLIHSEARRFVCSVCKKGFKQLAQLQNHSVIHLDKEKDVVPQWYSKKLCKQCSKYFADSKSLKKHIQAVHTKLKPYICQVCNHQSSRKSMLEMHMRQHTGDKPYSCDTCDYKTGDHNSLRRHKQRHMGERLYVCPFCDYGTIQCSSYKAHVLKKHPDNVGKESKVFICTDCLFKTVCLDTFISHQDVHKPKKETVITTPTETLNESSSIAEEAGANSAQSVESVFMALPREISTSKRGFAPNSQKSRKKSKGLPSVEEEDSLHATTDFGGITIPADSV